MTALPPCLAAMVLEVYSVLSFLSFNSINSGFKSARIKLPAGKRGLINARLVNLPSLILIVILMDTELLPQL